MYTLVQRTFFIPVPSGDKTSEKKIEHSVTLGRTYFHHIYIYFRSSSNFFYYLDVLPGL
jgi:hypothetical protein